MPSQERVPPSTDRTPSRGVLESKHDATSSAQPPTTLSRTWRYLNETIRPSTFVELELLILTFCIGLQGKSTQTPPPPSGLELTALS